MLEKAVPVDGEIEYDPMRQWDCLFAEPGHGRIDRRAMGGCATASGDRRGTPPPQTKSRARCGYARVRVRNQTGVSGRDGELDDWGTDWEKKKKKKKKST